MSFSGKINASVESATYYVDDKWVKSHKTTFLKKHVLARGVHIFLTPVTFISSALDTIIGLEAGIGVICTLGKSEPIRSDSR